MSVDTLIRAAARLASRSAKWRYTVDERVAMEGVAVILLNGGALPKKQVKIRICVRDDKRLRRRSLGIADIFMSVSP